MWCHISNTGRIKSISRFSISFGFDIFIYVEKKKIIYFFNLHAVSLDRLDQIRISFFKFLSHKIKMLPQKETYFLFLIDFPTQMLKGYQENTNKIFTNTLKKGILN